MVKAAALLFGIVFLAVGILGFVPAATTPMEGMDGGMLLGIFHVNAAHNYVHLASGAVFLLCGLAGAGPSRMFFKLFGIVYAIIAIMGFMSGDKPLLGLISNNMAIVYLHCALAVVMLLLGFVVKDNTATS